MDSVGPPSFFWARPFHWSPPLPMFRSLPAGASCTFLQSPQSLMHDCRALQLTPSELLGAPASAQCPPRPSPQPRGRLWPVCNVQRPHSRESLVHKMLYDWAVRTATPIWPRHRGDKDPKLQKVYKEGSESTTVGRPGHIGPGGSTAWPHCLLPWDTMAATTNISLKTSTSPRQRARAPAGLWQLFTFQHFDTVPVRFVFKKST